MTADAQWAVPTWLERRVQLPDGRTHAMLVDAAQTDATTEMYLKGDGIWVNSYLVSVMMALTKPGSRVLDLGGFVGEFALAAATHGCEVVSVEANPGQAQLLATSAELNHFDGLRVIHAAVGDQTGTVSFASRGPYGQIAHGDDTAGVDYDRVMQVTVDDLITALGWTSVDFVKIDIEGSEAAALTGASRLLAGPDAPAVLIECNTFVLRGLSPDPAALLRQLEGFGYTLYRITPGGIWPWNSTQFQPEVVSDYLALKDATPNAAGLDVQPSLALDDAAAIVNGQAALGSFDHSIALAWALRFAPTELLAHPDVQSTVESLRQHPADEIRSQAALIGEPAPPATPVTPTVRLHETFDGAWAAERVLRESAEARLAIAAGLRLSEPDDIAPEPLATGSPLPGPRALALARRISEFADRHQRLASVARRIIRPGA